jgi:SAM-dependent methyltransferase
VSQPIAAGQKRKELQEMPMQVEEFPGYCPICESAVIFTASGPWYRDTLICPGCKSVVRERALALRIKQLYPDWKSLAIHEIAPIMRGFTRKLNSECSGYIATHWFPSESGGVTVRGFRNENIEAQTFGNASFDLVVSLDVMEHIFDPAAAYREIFRTLKPGGAYIHTFPITKSQVFAMIDRAARNTDGTVHHFVNPPEYHGNPISEARSLVTKSYGYDIGQKIAEWTPFDIDITRYWDRSAGIMGWFTEVVVCRKPIVTSRAAQ